MKKLERIPGFLKSVEALEQRYLVKTSPEDRRAAGATFTPQWVVDLMLRRAASGRFSSIVDAGAGAGRFSLAAAQWLPKADITAIEVDRDLVAGLRAIARKSRFASRIHVVSKDFLEAGLPPKGPRLFIGNPPYVRHHTIGTAQKDWLRKAGEAFGESFSALSGLHVYFLARILMEARAGDGLTMILPSEWLETRYGRAIKSAILARCAKVRLLLFSAATHVFPGVLTTSLILELKFGRGTRVIDVVAMDDQTGIARRQAKVLLPKQAGGAENWLRLARQALSASPCRSDQSATMIELGEIFDVHRGQVTGKNSVWIASTGVESLIPERYLHPCITDAAELFGLPDVILRRADGLRRVIDLPADLSVLTDDERERVDHFLKLAKDAGGADGYIARHRRPWWRVSLKRPPVLIMTYMARRPPRFVVNDAGVRLINIAHGLYPKASLSQAQLVSIARWLSEYAGNQVGRTYAGGLLKIEPRDAARIRVPDPRTFELAA